MKEAVHISGAPVQGPDLQELLVLVAMGDQDAFAEVYDAVCGPVLGLVRSVLRDPAQSEEVAQEVLVEVWRTAPRFRASRGSAMNWVLTLAHRRAVDRVRSAEGLGGQGTPGRAAGPYARLRRGHRAGRDAAGEGTGPALSAQPVRAPAPVGEPGLLPGPDLP
ncbi:DNA-directed RNA polymerase specialized sigma24 family protein [Streptomyces sp. TE33382]